MLFSENHVSSAAAGPAHLHAPPVAQPPPPVVQPPPIVVQPPPPVNVPQRTNGTTPRSPLPPPPPYHQVIPRPQRLVGVKHEAGTQKFYPVF